ncbi:DNA primase small subunit domain-containing protein [Thermogladius sp. 4427co]|uniref:DNA primase small subunit domain-containing protein n=1 Tax=Thermogladius sp. 4427co TaxID=3450718 RepID=UPI003F79A204
MSRLELNKAFLRRILNLYYSKRPLVEPPDLHSREIAIVDLDSEAYIRHLSFPNMAQLYSFILGKKTPLHIYYSSALYNDPSVEKMDLKGWRGSELIFDIDVDHLPGCDLKLEVCVRDNTVLGEGEKRCPSGVEPVELDVLEPECFDKGLDMARRLVGILEEDLGFKEVEVYFSGNRGFHIRVVDEYVLDLTREMRAMIADYVSCENIDVENVFPQGGSRGSVFVYFTGDEIGVRKRVLEAARRKGLLEEVAVEKIGLLYRMPFEYLKQVLDEVCIKIDRVVTMDTSRLSRFEKSINGKAGLKVAKIDLSKTNRFEYRDFFAWSGRVLVSPLVDLSGVRVLDLKLDLKRGLKTELEAPYAIYLVLKKLAVYVSDKGVEAVP